MTTILKRVTAAATQSITARVVGTLGTVVGAAAFQSGAFQSGAFQLSAGVSSTDFITKRVTAAPSQSITARVTGI